MKKGFTLIEILVVVAIIGLLSAVILVSVGGARTKSANAAIKVNLKKVVAIIGSKQIDGSFDSSMCLTGEISDDPSTGDSNLDSALIGLKKSGVLKLTCNIGTNGDVAASAPLLGGSNLIGCVDSTGKESSKAASGGVCP